MDRIWNFNRQRPSCRTDTELLLNHMTKQIVLLEQRIYELENKEK